MKARLLAFLLREVRLSVWLLLALAVGLYGIFVYDHWSTVWRIVDAVNAVKYRTTQSMAPRGGASKTTALLDLDFRSFDLSATADINIDRRFGAIESLGEGRLLLGTDYGQFFLIETSEETATPVKIPVRLDTNRQKLIDYAASKGIRVIARWIRLDDLLLFDQRRQLAASYSYWDDERHCVALRVAVRPVPSDWRNDTGGEWRDVFRSEPCLPLKTSRNALASLQSGGRLVEGGAGKLLLSVGDFEFDGLDGLPQYSQDPHADYGKVMEIDLASGAKRIFSSGHRNPQGLARDAQGRLWSTEHGPRGGDELNLVVEGENYGWPKVTLGTDYGPRPWPLALRQGRHEQFRGPVYAFLPSVGTSQVLQVHNFADEWDGDLLLASMEVKTLFRIRLVGDAVQYVEPIALGHRLRDMLQADDGTVWIWTDEANLLRVRAKPQSAGPEVAMAKLTAPGKAAVEGCLTCHDLSSTSSVGRIPLGGVNGRPIASVADVTYTRALKALGGTWTPSRLDAFIAAPDKVAPGTAMASQAVADAMLRAQIVQFLANLK